jgi:hypothetical protein
VGGWRYRIWSRIDIPRTYGFAGAAGAGAVSVAAGGAPSSILDAWRRVLGTTRSKATTEMTMARIKGDQPLPFSSTSGVFGSADIYSSVGFLTGAPWVLAGKPTATARA